MRKIINAIMPILLTVLVVSTILTILLILKYSLNFFVWLKIVLILVFAIGIFVICYECSDWGNNE